MNVYVFSHDQEGQRTQHEEVATVAEMNTGVSLACVLMELRTMVPYVKQLRNCTTIRAKVRDVEGRTERGAH